MKKLLLLIVFLGVQQVVLAQDIIVKTTGEELPARVLEITLLVIILSSMPLMP